MKMETTCQNPCSVRKYSSEWKPGDQPYYPVNDQEDGEIYQKYKALAEKEEKVCVMSGKTAYERIYVASAAEC